MAEPIRFEIRLKPGSSGTSVGGTWGRQRALNVAVTQQPVDDRANAAALELLATILKVRKHQLTIISGHRHRTKVIELAEPPPDTQERLEAWRTRK
ncbi:MAG: DUF167 domain-containing protein [Acidimicrobiia bacterium]|nr:DUF167 domain-containing protein [Acidimicrobiia bacterium]MBT8250698.1 DUF167 domain-containing protein [Acidimicrobiia bacterium]NNC42399.1 DUF167 domain-containing protein [Acidimicrobiia bacterium]NNL28862.1 DUF167 domain-containing protein [Acidimicrobiia bacterium]